MKAVLLVGGEGTRLRPLTLVTPKPLLPIGGQAFVDRQLAWLEGHGITDVVLAVGYRSEAFLEHFASRTSGPRTRIVIEDQPLGTAGAIRFAAEQAGLDERLVVCNGDVLTTLDVTRLVRFHDEHGAEATIHLTRVPDPSAFGVVVTTPDGAVEAFIEKPPPGEAPTDWVNAGTYVLEPSVLDRIPSAAAVSVERETFPALLSTPGSLYALGTDDYWLDMGTPEKYRQANLDVLAGRLGTPPGPGAHEDAPGIWLQPDVSIAADAVLEAPVLVGRGAVIGEGARVGCSTIGAGSVIEAGAVVRGSVVLDAVHVAAGVTVRDSILGPGARSGPAPALLEGRIVVAVAVDASSHPSSTRRA